MGKITPCGGILAPSERGLSAKPTGGVLRGRQIAGNKDAPPPWVKVSVTKGWVKVSVTKKVG